MLFLQVMFLQCEIGVQMRLSCYQLICLDWGQLKSVALMQGDQIGQIFDKRDVFIFSSFIKFA
jgi:hypothetical protein